MADSSILLTSRDHTRRRPGMYIGGVDARALHHMIFEIIEHMVEEASIARCTHIWLTLRPENEVVIQDNSLGLPMSQTEYDGLTMMEALLERSGVFRDVNGDYYATGSLFGVGPRAVNALSTEMVVENAHAGQLWIKSYHEGIPNGPLTQVGSVPADEHGTKFTFTPDFTILERNSLDFDLIVARCRELAYLVAGLHFTIRDERITPPRETTLCAADGLKTWIQELNIDGSPIHEIVHVVQEIPSQTGSKTKYTIKVEFAFQFTKSSKSHIKSYVNMRETDGGGTHLTALQMGILGYLNKELPLELWLDKNLQAPRWQEISRGLNAIISIWHPYAVFSGAMMNELQFKNDDVFGPISAFVSQALRNQLQNFDTRREFFWHFHPPFDSNSPDADV